MARGEKLRSFSLTGLFLFSIFLLFCFAVIHSGGAALRAKAERVIGPRAWRLIFAFVSIPSAFILIDLA